MRVRRLGIGRHELTIVALGDLLFASQVEAGSFALEREHVDLATLGRDAIQSARSWAEKNGVELDLEGSGTAWISGDPSRLAQLLDNLVSIAIKFTPGGSSVKVRLQSVGELAVIEVSDTGMGFPVDEQERLFERFFRADGDGATVQAIQGSGLGLAIVKAIVEAHGGSISVQSAADRGTTFRVELPASVREATAA